jgi:hypothetical protein
MKKSVVVFWKRSTAGNDGPPDGMSTQFIADDLSVKDGLLTITESISGMRRTHIPLSGVHSWSEEPAKQTATEMHGRAYALAEPVFRTDPPATLYRGRGMED